MNNVYKRYLQISATKCPISECLTVRKLQKYTRQTQKHIEMQGEDSVQLDPVSVSVLAVV